MLGWRLIFAWVAAVCAASAASSQPAQGPLYFEVATTAGARERIVADREDLSLLQTQLETRDFQARRAAVRMICAGRCPEGLRHGRPTRDVIEWEDGRRTSGALFVYRNVVEQDGERAGLLEDVRVIELGTARLPDRLVRGLEPRVVEAYWLDPWDGGEFVVFRQPWVTLSEQAITFRGRPPFARGANLRSIRLADTYPNGRAPWPEEDIVAWQDGTRTTGAVTVAGGFVEQPGRPRRAFSEVAYIDFARR